MIAYVKELYKFRELILVWSIREVRVRYKQSILGAAWAILQPLSMMAIFTVIFSLFAKMPSDGIPYPIFSYSALLPWTLFSSALSYGIPSLVYNLNLVVKTYFPREVLPIGVVGASLLDYLIASSIFLVMMIYYDYPLRLTMLWIPVILLIQLMLALGVAFIGSALLVFYRDVRFIIPLGTQLWFYATPIIYSSSIIPERFQTIYALNPMVGVINAYRRVILYGENPVWSELGLAAVVSVIIFVLGYYIFKRLEVSFADLI